MTTISQGIYTIDPDTYLFWDDLHPTTRGHNILAQVAFGMLAAHERWGIQETNSESMAVGGVVAANGLRAWR